MPEPLLARACTCAQVQHSETGDALWAARARANPAETYALDYVVERKGIADLVNSIKVTTHAI